MVAFLKVFSSDFLKFPFNISPIRFNGHLRKKGISGQIKISYEEKTLSVEVSSLFCIEFLLWTTNVFGGTAFIKPLNITCTLICGKFLDHSVLSLVG